MTRATTTFQGTSWSPDAIKKKVPGMEQRSISKYIKREGNPLSQTENSAEITNSVWSAILIRAGVQCDNAYLLAAEVFTPTPFICSLSNLSKNAKSSFMLKSEEQILLTISEVTQELHNYLSVLSALPKRHFFPPFPYIDDLRPNN